MKTKRTLVTLMHNAGRYLALGIILTLLNVAHAAPAPGDPGDGVEAETMAEGLVQSLDMANSALVIQGMRYVVSPDVHVEIAGSYGAYTMLQPGMRVAYAYHIRDDGTREVYEVREIVEDRELLLY